VNIVIKLLLFHQVMSQQNRHVTRFIALSGVANPKKLKWLYAFSIVPMKKMDRRDLVIQPPDATDCPYVGDELKVVIILCFSNKYLL